MTEQSFWKWFMINQEKYIVINQVNNVEKKEMLLDDLLNQLHSYCSELYFEVGGLPNEPQDLIISAGGNPDYFERAEKLVAQAPKLDGWNFIALKPPMGLDFITEYEGVNLDPNKSWFMPLDFENDPLSLGLRIHLPNFRIENEKQYLNGCYQMIDTILGEKSAANDVQHIEVDNLPTNPEKEGLIEIADLVEYIKWRKTKLINSSGE